MTERVFVRGSSCESKSDAIVRKLNLPTNWVADELSEIPPGQSFSEDLTHREAYARSVARERHQFPCVIKLHLNEGNFPIILGKVWNSKEESSGLFKMGFGAYLIDGPAKFSYELVSDFDQLHHGVIVIAVALLTDKDLLMLKTEVGFEEPGQTGFAYKEYEEYIGGQ